VLFLQTPETHSQPCWECNAATGGYAVIPYLSPQTFPFAQATYTLEASEQALVHLEPKSRKPSPQRRRSSYPDSVAATLELLILRIMWFV